LHHSPNYYFSLCLFRIQSGFQESPDKKRLAEDRSKRWAHEKINQNKRPIYGRDEDLDSHSMSQASITPFEIEESPGVEKRKGEGKVPCCKGFTWSELSSNKIVLVVFAFFILSGVFGLASFAINFVDNSLFTGWLPLILFVVAGMGLVALQFWGSTESAIDLYRQISNFFRWQSERLTLANRRFEGQMSELSSEVQKLEAIEMKLKNENHNVLQNHLQLEVALEELQSKKSELRQEIEAAEKIAGYLKRDLEETEERNNEMYEKLEHFSHVQEALQETLGSDLTPGVVQEHDTETLRLLNKAEGKLKQLDVIMTENRFLTLRRHAHEKEGSDSGWNRKEFEGFKLRVSGDPHYSDIARYRFEDLDADKNEVIDLREMEGFIWNVIEEKYFQSHGRHHEVVLEARAAASLSIFQASSEVSDSKLSAPSSRTKFR